MREAVIVSTARTPIGKAYRGAFNDTSAQELAGHAIEKAVERAKREHSNGRGSSSTILYDRARLRSQKERRRKQVERWCSDADASIAAVIERERRRLEHIR